MEEESLNNNMNGTIAASPNKSEANNDHDQFHPTTMTMNKSYSITDFLNTIDYSALSQLLDAPAEPEPPLIYPTTTQTHHEALLNYNNYVNNSHFNLPQVDAYSDHVATNCNGLKRKRVMTMDGAESSFDDDGSSNFSRKLLKLPSDSRSSSHSHFGSTTSSYCNQQLVDTSGFQHSSLLSYPFLEMQ